MLHTYTRRKKWLTLVIGFVEAFLFGGTIFGWAALAYVFKTDGVFVNLCQDVDSSTNVIANEMNMSGNSSQHGHESSDISSATPSYHSGNNHTDKLLGCEQQDTNLNLAFAIAIACMGLFSFPIGWLFDRYGLMVTRLAAACLSVAALIMLATCDGELSWLLFPSLPMLAVSNAMIIITSNHICSLAGNYTSSLIAIYAGVISASALVASIVKMAHDFGIARWVSLLVLGSLWSIVLVSTFLLLPRYKVTGRRRQTNKEVLANGAANLKAHSKLLPVPTVSDIDPDTGNILIPDAISEEVELAGLVKQNGDHQGNATELAALGKGQKEEYEGTSDFRQVLRTFYVVSHLIWFAVQHLRIQYFIGSFLDWSIYILSDEKAQVALASDVFGYTLLVCLVLSLPVGILLDKERRKIPSSDVSFQSKAARTCLALVLSSSSTILMGVCLLVPATWVVFAAPLFCNIARSFFYATAIAYIDIVFPKEHFGKIFGLMYLFGGSANFLQYALHKWTASRGYTEVNIFLLVLTVLTLVQPIVIWIRNIRRANKNGKC